MKLIDLSSDGNCLFSAVLLADAAAAESPQPTEMNLMIDGLQLRFNANDLLREIWAISNESGYNSLGQNHVLL